MRYMYVSRGGRKCVREGAGGRGGERKVRAREGELRESRGNKEAIKYHVQMYLRS